MLRGKLKFEPSNDINCNSPLHPALYIIIKEGEKRPQLKQLPIGEVKQIIEKVEAASYRLSKGKKPVKPWQIREMIVNEAERYLNKRKK